MATKQEITQSLRDFLAMDVSDKSFPLRKEAYKMLGEKPKSKPTMSNAVSPSKFLEDVGWEPLDTIPRGRPIEVLSVTGKIRSVTARSDQKIKNGRLYCWGNKGSATAVKWREA